MKKNLTSRIALQVISPACALIDPEGKMGLPRFDACLAMIAIFPGDFFSSDPITREVGWRPIMLLRFSRHSYM